MKKEFDAASIYHIISNRLENNNITHTVDNKNRISTWEFSYVRKKDINAEKDCINSLINLENSDSKGDLDCKIINKKLLQDLSLAAKNRAEAISAVSDFYPVGATVVVLLFTAFAAWFDFINLKSFKLLISGIILLIYGFYAISRFKTRQQVADLKTAANILDVTEKRI
ncbi:hypothetical protein ACSFA3_22130 [Variovorax sp. RHLX14]|uniref:hypothetical protein n=1 Tax=Variovorax sp. RHLX14 TaxID=1259731 RepID=UPI003F4863F3